MADTFVHASAVVDDGAEVGSGTRIWHFCHVLKGTRLGENCVLGQNVMVGPDVEIGNGCKIQNNVSLYKGVTLEDEVFCGPSCVFTNVYSPRAFVERKEEFLPTLVKRGATIGANATVLCGVIIGEYALLGAGSLLRSDMPPYAIFVGVPAKHVGWVCKCGSPLSKGTIGDERDCERCGSRYRLEDGSLAVVRETL